ncbi:S-adenosyl-L-methionine-dependent methyltransferase [Endogone sp. FLAS-F59071]|nr:S-adenosyl-L-methionine-dependent methyltransferase [Endogone sp. FLAS-F59071]|eukprot:RUS23305.1 S-adenosyl-L-methionine-dependent methyltransferase [Endogone sp. FLAS-F59071]
MTERVELLKTIVPNDCNGFRALKYLTSRYRSTVGSKLRCQRSFRRGEVRINGDVAEETRILKKGDLVELRYDKDEDERQTLEKIDVKIIWEDEDVVVAWKIAGMNFHKFEKALGLNVGKIKNEGQSEHSYSGVRGGGRIWCAYQLEKAAYGLIIAAKNLQAKEKLLEAFQNGDIKIRYRVICHGRMSPNNFDTLPAQYTFRSATAPAITEAPNEDEDGDDDDCDVLDDKPNSTISAGATVISNPLRSLALVSTTRSNSSSYLSTIDVWPVPLSTGLHLRRFFYFATKHPIVGGSTYTKPLKSNRDKGLCLAVLEVEFQHPLKEGERVRVENEEPPKFEIIRAREQKFWEKKRKEEEEELRRAGVSHMKVDEQGTIDSNGIDQVEYDGAKKMPVAYIVGEKEFYNLRFKVNQACLIPRSSTETLVQSALDLLKQKLDTQEPPSPAGRLIHILDIGTGCGNIILSILHNTRDFNVYGLGIDISQSTLDLATENANLLDLSGRTTFCKLDLALLDNDCENSVLFPQMPFDMIVCNPPYLSETTVARKDHYGALVEFEPREAVFCGEDGYGCYRALGKVLKRGLGKVLTKKGGWVVLECGKGMASRVREIFEPWMNVVEVSDV